MRGNPGKVIARGAARLRDTRRQASFLRALPLAVPAGLAAFGAVALGLLLPGYFYTWLVLPLGLIAGLAAMYLTHRVVSRADMPGSRREQTVCAALVVFGALLWIGANVPFAYQHIFTDRDPATYGVAGARLVTQDDLRIPVPSGFADVPGTDPTSLGFSRNPQNDGEIYAQGSHILPAFLGLAGRIGGYDLLFRANLLFGGAALLALFAFARLVMKPRWALLATVTLSISLPLIYFARDTYTEPMALTFIFASLAFLWHARQAGTDRRYAAWGLAGLCLGAGLMARIDTYLVLAAVGVYLAISLCLTERTQRRAQLRYTALFATVTAGMALLAWLDLSQLASGYYRDLRPEYLAELLLIAAVAVLSAIAVTLSWRTGLLRRLDQNTRPWRAQIGTLALTTFFVFLVSRSAWQTNYAMKGETLVRSYAEHSVIWMSWYLGPVVALLGLAAIVWAWRSVLQGRRLALLPALCVIGVCIMYLVNPSISSDQVWASRRFLPVILPGLTLLCFLLLNHLYERKSVTIRGWAFQPQVATAVLATLAVIGPLFVSAPFLATRSYAPQLAQIEFVCDNIPANAVVAWVGDARDYAIQPTQAFCGVPSIGVRPDADLPATFAGLAKVAKQQQKRVVIGVKDGGIGAHDVKGGSATLPPEQQRQLTTRSSITYTDLEQTYKKFPRNRAAYTQTLSLGELTRDGQVAAIQTADGKTRP